MTDTQKVITLLGSAGGAAKSVLAILNQSAVDTEDAIHHLIKDSTLHLIDIEQKEKAYYQHLFPHLQNQLILHQFDLADTKHFSKHLTQSHTNIVIDVSWADTIEMVRCCNQLGILYVNSALENAYIDENEKLYAGFTLIERIYAFEKQKDTFTNTTAIIGSGMNPGVVQWMALELLKESSTEKPIGMYIVEYDSSFFKDKNKAEKDVLYTTWSPVCFLDEAIDSYPMLMQHATPLFLYEEVYSLRFKVQLGDKQFEGCLMPHEEVYTLCQLYDVEGGFLYRVNDHTTTLITTHLDEVDELWNYDMKVLNPLEEEMIGEDLVGVLLVYPDKECYMYNVMTNQSVFSQYKTNATYFQVACGIYASLCVLLLDSIPNGAYYVDELLLHTQNQYGQYLKHYMKDFVTGTNDHTDGLLLQRLIKKE